MLFQEKQTIRYEFVELAIEETSEKQTKIKKYKMPTGEGGRLIRRNDCEDRSFFSKPQFVPSGQ